MAKDGRRFSVSVFRSACLAAAFLIGGCGAGSAPMMPTWAPREQSYVPTVGSSNAYDAYALIARNVEESVPDKLLNRVYFDPPLRNEALSRVSRPLTALVASTKKSCEFRYTATPMFAPAPYQRGWRLLGRCLTWNIEKACALGAYDQAIATTVAATKFGFDLTGGAATDASLGFEIADEARKAVAPYLAKFGAGQLAVLGAGLERALASRPPLHHAIEHEHGRMLQGVQYVQDAFANERFGELLDRMREDVRDGVSFLRDLRSRDRKRAAYFEGFAAEADEQTRWLKVVAQVPAVRRATEPGPKLAKVRPWKSFAKQFFTAAERLLPIEDATVARTRLAILTCEMLRQVKSAQSAPKDLSGFPKELTIDPYTGRPFAYRASGPIFEVYSLGADGIDDAGDTDENFTAPDLCLEQK